MDNILNPNIPLSRIESKEILSEGIVTSIDNYYKNNTIQIKVNGIETDCRPFLPIYLMIIPRVGDSVKLILEKTGTITGYQWIGPIIVDYKRMDSSTRIGDKIHIAGKPINKYPKAKGVYPLLDDITINGKWNSDLRLGNNQTLLRAGFHEINEITNFNTENQSYILLRLANTNNNKTVGTTNVVGEYINLLSHKGTPNFDLHDRENTITDETIQKILKEAHQMVYGDNLVDLLKLLIYVTLNHNHNFHKMSATMDTNEKKLAEFDLTTLLSKYIRLN